MNVSQQNIDNVNAVITIEITKADYQEKVDKALRTYRQKATIPGFRKGMVPMGMVRKMFGKSAQAEEINNTVSEQLSSYIRENKLNILGQPMPSLDQPEIDFDTQEDFTFLFDIALAPAFEISLNQEDVVDYQKIVITDKMVSDQVEQLRQRFSTQEVVEVADEKSMMKGELVELDEAGNVKEGGITVENAIIAPNYFKADDQKALFAEAKTGDKITFNPDKACESHEAELASMLHITKEQVADAKADFTFEVVEITTQKLAEMEQPLFDQALGEGIVASEEEFVAKVREMLTQQVEPESDFKFGLNARTAIENKVGDLELPVATLKRWMLASDENRSAETIDEEFSKMLPDLKWHLIKEQLIKQFEIKVAEADVMDMAKKITKAQFAQYGMISVPEEVLENYSKEMLGNKETLHSIVDRATENKIIQALKEVVTLNVIETSVEDFYKTAESND